MDILENSLRKNESPAFDVKDDEVSTVTSDSTDDKSNFSGNISWETAMIYATELTFRARKDSYSFIPYYTSLRLDKDAGIVMTKRNGNLFIEEDGIKEKDIKDTKEINGIRGIYGNSYNSDETEEGEEVPGAHNETLYSYCDTSYAASDRDEQTEQEQDGIIQKNSIHGLEAKPSEEDAQDIQDIDIMSVIFSEMTEHNIFEFKSQGEDFNLIVFLHALWYVTAYIRGMKWPKSIDLKDVTLILIKTSYPSALIKELSEKSDTHCHVECLVKGVYRITGFFSPVLMLIPKEIGKGFELLSILTRNAREEDVREVIRMRDEAADQDTKEKINVILKASAEINEELFKKPKEEIEISEAFKIIFPEEWERIKKYKEDIRQKNIEIEKQNAELKRQNAEIERQNAEIERQNEEIKRENAELEKLNNKIEQKDLELEGLENINKLSKSASQGLSNEIRRELLKKLISSGKNGESISYSTGFTRDIIDFVADELKVDVKWNEDGASIIPISSRRSITDSFNNQKK